MQGTPLTVCHGGVELIIGWGRNITTYMPCSQQSHMCMYVVAQAQVSRHGTHFRKVHLNIDFKD